MKKGPIHVLYLEDNPYDVELVQTTLISEGIECTIESVQSCEEFVMALVHGGFDIILADYALPSFNGMSALSLAKEKRPDTPFILLSGQLGEELAVECLKCGATDFVLKQSLCRLVPSIKRALEEAEERTKTKEVEHQLIQSDKMASLGQMAAGIAHEINNPVGYVASNLDTLKDYIKVFKKIMQCHDKLLQRLKNKQNLTDIDIQKLISNIDETKKEEDFDFILNDISQMTQESNTGIEKIENIIQSLRRFSRMDEGEIKKVNINQIIEDTLKVVWNQLKYKCTVQKKLGKIPAISCNPVQINQVLTNLIINASQAIEKKGKLTLETYNKDSQVIIKVTDTGQGIEPDKLGKIFDPFFTTKPTGTGTGLGLSISRGIIEKHKGTIDVKSRLGKGTTFEIHLPIKGIETVSYKKAS